MPSIEGLSVKAIQVPHPPGEIGLRRLDQQMVMVIYQAGRMAEPPNARHLLSCDGQPGLAIRGIPHNLLPGIPSTGDVGETAYGHASRSGDAMTAPVTLA